MIRNLLAAIGCLTVIVVLALLGWYFQDDLREWWENRGGVAATEPSPELADAAAAKVEDLFAGREEEIRLDELELQSYLQFRALERLPRGVHNPALDLQDSTAAMSVDLNLAELGGASRAADNLRRFMGDSARVDTELYPRLLEEGRVGLTVLSLQAGMVPVPALFIPNILAQTGFEVTGGRTLVIPVSRDIREVRIEDEEVVLQREER